jgi:hypothetical protein
MIAIASVSRGMWWRCSNIDEIEGNGWHYFYLCLVKELVEKHP